MCKYQKRHQDAVTAYAGATNPRAVVEAIRRGIAELDRAETGTDYSMVSREEILNDPPLRVMVYQLFVLFLGEPTKVDITSDVNECLAVAV